MRNSKIIFDFIASGKAQKESGGKSKKESKPGQKRGPVLDGWKEKQSGNKRKVKAAATNKTPGKLKSKSGLKQREKMIQKRAGVRDPGRDQAER